MHVNCKLKKWECKKTPDHQKQDVSTILIEKLIKLTIKKVKILEKSLKFKFLVMNKLSHSTYLIRLRVTQNQRFWLSLSILKIFSYPL